MFAALHYSRLSAALSVGVSILLSIAAFVVFRRLEDRQIEAEFTRRCSAVAAAFRNTLETRFAVLNSVASFYAASDEVRRDEFRTYSASLLSQMPAVQALSWDLRVQDADRAAYERAARADGYHNFHITERDAAGTLVPASRRPHYIPVCFLEPLAGNEPAMGFDLASDVARKAALDAARDTGRMAATERLRLVQEAGDQFGFLVFLPVYHNRWPRATIDERRSSLKGFASAVFRLPDIADRTLRSGYGQNMHLVVADASPGAGRTVLFESPESGEGVPHWPVYESVFDVGGRAWAMQARPTRAYLAEHRAGRASTFLIAIPVLTILLGVLIVQSGRRAERLARSDADLQRAMAGMLLARTEAELLDGVMQKINVGVGLDQILDYVFESFREIIPYDRIGFAMVEDNGRLVRSRWARSRSGRLVLPVGYSVRLAGSSLQAVVASGQPRIIRNLEAYVDDHCQTMSARLIVAEGMRSNLTCPLTVTGEAVGFLFFSSVQPDAYGQHHAQTFMRIAHQLALCVHKGQLYDEIGEELYKSQERFALAVRGTDAGIWDWNVQTGHVYFSPRWKSMLGCAEHEIANRFEDWEGRVHPEDHDRALATIRDYLEGRSPTYELEHRLRHRDGSYRWIVARGAAVYHPNGEAYRMVGSHIDVTDRKSAEQSLRATNAELLAAQKIQEQLLPRAAPAIPGLDIAGACYPSHFTAGDYFDYLVMEDGSLVLVIADVSGHGFGPALVAAKVHAHLRSFAGTSLDIDEMAARLNRLLCQTSENGRFVTLLLARLDLQALNLRCVNAGHPPAYLFDESGSVKAVLGGDSLPLGIDLQAEFSISDPVSLAPGDLLLLMTDGIVEARSPDDSQFGIQRVLDLVHANRSQPARELIATIRSAATRFAQCEDLPDDLTAVVLKIERKLDDRPAGGNLVAQH